MPPSPSPSDWTWFRTGDEMFGAMLGAIQAAGRSVRLETYILSPGELAERFRKALIEARSRGVLVQVLIDALGSSALPKDFWRSLQATGGEARWFNPISLRRMGIRDHRKLLVCDEHIGFIGGYNLAPEYEGDGVTRGWCDLGARLAGPLVKQLALAFDEMFARADFLHKRFVRYRLGHADLKRDAVDGRLLLSGPGRGPNAVKVFLRHDLLQAKDVSIIVPYFLPTRRIRKALANVARRGGKVRLLLAGKSDVRLSKLASCNLYREFLRAGVELYEYQPQILHAKMVVVDEAVYVGSANLDQRSLNINYELMVRQQDARLATDARAIFEARLAHSRRITREEWRAKRTLATRLAERMAYFLLVRVDPFIARAQWRRMSD